MRFLDNIGLCHQLYVWKISNPILDRYFDIWTIRLCSNAYLFVIVYHSPQPHPWKRLEPQLAKTDSRVEKMKSQTNKKLKSIDSLKRYFWWSEELWPSLSTFCCFDFITNNRINYQHEVDNLYGKLSTWSWFSLLFWIIKNIIFYLFGVDSLLPENL